MRWKYKNKYFQPAAGGEDPVCNHVKNSPTAEEKTSETVQTDSQPYQDNLGFRHGPDLNTEYDSEYDRGGGAEPEPGDSYHESGSYTDSYDDASHGGGSVQGYRIPYRLMRDPVSPPPQPTHRAPGLPPGYRQYSRTILVETGPGGGGQRRPSYVSTICVQPQSTSARPGRSTHWSSEQELRE